MKLPRLSALAFVGSLGFLGGATLSQEPADASKPPSAAEIMQMQMEMMQLALPGPEHEEMAKGEGLWDLETTMKFPPMPGMEEMPPMKATGEAVNEMILGGRWMMMTSTGSMMGQEFESLGFFGYDRRHDEYVTIGLDTSGTYFVTAKGKRGQDGKIRMYGTDDDGMGGQDFFFEIDESDPDRVLFSISFTKMAGMTFDPPFKMVEMIQTRREDG